MCWSISMLLGKFGFSSFTARVLIRILCGCLCLSFSCQIKWRSYGANGKIRMQCQRWCLNEFEIKGFNRWVLGDCDIVCCVKDKDCDRTNNVRPLLYPDSVEQGEENKGLNENAFCKSSGRCSIQLSERNMRGNIKCPNTQMWKLLRLSSKYTFHHQKLQKSSKFGRNPADSRKIISDLTFAIRLRIRLLRKLSSGILCRLPFHPKTFEMQVGL